MLALSLSDKFCCFGIFVFNRFLFCRFSFVLVFIIFLVLVLVFVNEFVMFSFVTVFVSENHTVLIRFVDRSVGDLLCWPTM